MNKIKKLFGTPWKATISSICAVLLLAGIFTGTAYAASAIAENNAIGNEKAQNFAFADAGVDPVTAKVAKTEFDFEQGQFVYEVEFYANDTEYTYLVKASNGEILKKELEINNPTGGKTVLNAKITLEDAKKIALTDAGVSSQDAVFTEEKLDKDQTLTVYDISFYTKDTEYEYEINASTGAVFSKSKETQVLDQSSRDQTMTSSQQESTTNTKSEQQTAQNSTGTQAQSSVTLESAKNTALSDAGVKASDATFTKSALDYDDGHKVYDIEFYTSTHEYDYEVSAETGKITKRDVEAFRVNQDTQGNNTSNSGDTGNYIGVEQAKSIAVSHAGLSVESVTFKKAKFERDDGHTVYEVEFLNNGIEYEYTIDAVSGSIMEYDCDRD